MDSKLLTPFIFLFVAAIIFYGGIWQQINAVQNLQTQVATEETALAKARTGNTKQDQLVDAWKGLDSAVRDRVDLGLPSGNDVPDLLVLLNNAAAGSGLLVENINIIEAQKAGAPTASAQPAQALQQPQSILVAVNARGDYPAIKAFLTGLQKNERIMDVQSFTISPAVTSVGQTPKGQLFGMTVTVKAYYGQ